MVLERSGKGELPIVIETGFKTILAQPVVTADDLAELGMAHGCSMVDDAPAKQNKDHGDVLTAGNVVGKPHDGPAGDLQRIGDRESELIDGRG